MADGLNQAMLLGNLGADPELRFTAGGKAVLRMRLATSRSWFDKERQQRQEHTEWHSVIVWGNRAQALAKILSVGSRIMVTGEIRTNTYDDREGVKRYRTEIHAREVLLAGQKPNTSRAPRDDGGDGYEPPDQPQGFDDGGNDEIPF